MTRRAKKKGDSRLMEYKHRFEMERGTLERDGKDWTNGETDILLDMWLEGRGIKVIADTLERPTETVKNKIWKVATGYQSSRHYQPGVRLLRMQRGALSKREREICEWGLFGEGQNVGPKRPQPMTVESIARILFRPILDISKYVMDRKLVRKGFL